MSVGVESWVKFFRDAGIPTGPAATYAMKFCDHRIKNDMLADLDKSILHDMGIAVMGDVIAILKHAKSVHAKCEREKLESEYVGQFKVSGLVSSRMETPPAAPAKPKPTAPKRTPPVSAQTISSNIAAAKKASQIKSTPKAAKDTTQETKSAQTVQVGTKRKTTVSTNVAESSAKGSSRSTIQKGNQVKLDSRSLLSSPVKTVTVTDKSLSDRFSPFSGSSKPTTVLKQQEKKVTVRLDKSALERFSDSSIPQKKARYMDNGQSEAMSKLPNQSSSTTKHKQAAMIVNKAAKTTSQKKSVFDRLGAEKETSSPSPSVAAKNLVKTIKPAQTESKYKSLKPLKKVTVVKSKPEAKVTGSVFSRLGAAPETPQQITTVQRIKEPISPPLWEDDEDDYVIDYSSHSVLKTATPQSTSRTKTSTSKPVKPVKPLRRLSHDDPVPSVSVFRRLGNKV